jgi:hypothetical protein
VAGKFRAGLKLDIALVGKSYINATAHGDFDEPQNSKQ